MGEPSKRPTKKSAPSRLDISLNASDNLKNPEADGWYP